MIKKQAQFTQFRKFVAFQRESQNGRDTLKASIRDADAIKYAVERSNVVVNMVGREWETRNFSFEDVHVEFPAKLAEICKEVGVERLGHVSASSGGGDASGRPPCAVFGWRSFHSSHGAKRCG